MTDILLSTLNAKFIHASLGLRYLMANLGPLRSRARMLEFDINQRPMEIAEVLLAESPKIIGLGVYIWNTPVITELAALLKRVRPDVILILGGPEVSHETESHPAVPWADYVITGEADLAFAELCRQCLEGRRPAEKIIHATLPDLNALALPYDFYSDSDIRSRLLYVEASRGCPFSCDFCLSSLDEAVRPFPLDRVFAEFDRLLERGATQFKFVDRTFNLNPATSQAILEYFLVRLRPGLFLHFEIVPDRLPESLRELIARFPAGSMQLEAGFQTFNPEVAARIHRRQDMAHAEDNLRFLRAHTHAHIHADLIAGLPGETLESFATGFDRLLSLEPQEIQVGILKRLPGAPIARHTAEWEMVYNPNPPYEILRNNRMDFGTLQRVRHFARAWDLVANSGQFVETAPMIWQGAPSAFHAFMEFTEWLFKQAGRGHGIALVRLAQWVFEYLTEVRHLDPQSVAVAQLRDYQRGGRSDLPIFLRPFHLTPVAPKPNGVEKTGVASRRQARHQA
jgi:radical SAM superfamily enzyme YgiQ (UPF0313 family)